MSGSGDRKRKEEDDPAVRPEDAVVHLELGQLLPNRFQPRTDFDPVDLQNLASSLSATGVLQPILVRKTAAPPDAEKGAVRYEIIAGERRWRAAKIAGLERIPALVKSIDDESAAVMALVENVQRTDLNAIEKAKAFRQIQAMTQGSQRDLAKQVGLERSTITNMLRLLELPEEIQQMVSRGTMSMGHARALLGLAGEEEQKTVAEQIVKKRLSVRQVEAMIQTLNQATQPRASGEPMKSPSGRPVWLNEIEENLSEALGASVSIRYGRKRSRITIETLGREEFERVYELLKNTRQ